MSNNAPLAVAFYKGKANGGWWQRLKGLPDWVIRRWTRSPYSHCEVVMPRPNGLFTCFSASFRDNGVRCKVMDLPADRWDLLPVANVAPSVVQKRFWEAYGEGYDVSGVLAFLWPWMRQNPQRLFCSEFCAQLLGFHHPARFSPGALYVYLKEKINE